MGLALGPGDLDQIVRRQARGLGQDRRGDHDLLAARETADHLRGRIVDRRQAGAQLRQRARFDPLDQVNQDIVEHADLRFVQSVGVAEKEVGDAPERFDALVLGAAFDGVFEFDDEGMVAAHLRA
ncbi:MAG TPA: hypothetical protein VEK73_08715 [Xanthobacteraceae bacterium]|nr:hypothetical protein [Xanthobacteraceae bacterium]